ncbi:MAG: hypothetical protein K2I66_07920, partial [Bacteroidales bacterium]|nr:hypothetical protein [Bacteroidales bacterium]
GAHKRAKPQKIYPLSINPFRPSFIIIKYIIQRQRTSKKVINRIRSLFLAVCTKKVPAAIIFHFVKIDFLRYIRKTKTIMTQKQAIQLFERRKVRTVWNDEQEKK